ncbi:hypothetical protein [Acinetobacter oleivorans]|uniref:hypothetical protein n=1 Tax=Acinetobacter oleivorans TaxID=1148157 RepID=UPI00125FC4CA|nr:hypothetical protein [Acinetobacter oleivorans]
MNVNAIPFNHIKVTGVTALVLIAGLASCEYKTAQSSHATKTQTFTPQIQPSTYGVLTAKITGKHSGIAVIKLDGFRVNVSFDFETHPDSYGVQGSEFTAVDVTQLTINEISDVNGKSYSDFTDYNDHRNINALLKGFIERNKLVGLKHD